MKKKILAMAMSALCCCTAVVSGCVKAPGNGDSNQYPEYKL